MFLLRTASVRSLKKATHHIFLREQHLFKKLKEINSFFYEDNVYATSGKKTNRVFYKDNLYGTSLKKDNHHICTGTTSVSEA